MLSSPARPRRCRRIGRHVRARTFGLAIARLTARYAGLSYGGWFLSHGCLCPIAEFDAGRDQDDDVLKYPRHKLPPGAQYINNFIFIPQEKRERVLARLT